MEHALGALLGAAVGDAGKMEGTRASTRTRAPAGGPQRQGVVPAAACFCVNPSHPLPRAVGAFLEFTSPKPAQVDRSMTLPGGGCWDIGPGQFTDDTELALCLGRGLAGAAPSAGFPTKAVAAQYSW